MNSLFLLPFKVLFDLLTSALFVFNSDHFPSCLPLQLSINFEPNMCHSWSCRHKWRTMMVVVEARKFLSSCLWGFYGTENPSKLLEVNERMKRRKR